jgi:alpha-tubulin suppressor-like RCC1 family protein
MGSRTRTLLALAAVMGAACRGVFGYDGDFELAPTLAAEDAGTDAPDALSADGALDGTDGSADSTADAGATPMHSIVAGSQYTCALRSAGVLCWGANIEGVLGTTTARDGPQAPAVVPVGITATALAAAAQSLHTCAIGQGGALVCWGADGVGQDGAGAAAGVRSPSTAKGLSHVVAAATHDGMCMVQGQCGRSCAVTADGRVACWGGDVSGSSASPVFLPAQPWRAVEVAIDNDTCALTDGGDVYCWGQTAPAVPTPVLLTSGMIHIAGGYDHTCAVTRSGGALCWGENATGQLGNGQTGGSPTPLPVTGLDRGVVEIVAGRGSTCALLSSGGVKCWGDNTSGQLGYGVQSAMSSTPVDVSDLSEVVDLAVGWSHACARKSDDSIWCWGNDEAGEVRAAGMAGGAASTPVRANVP